MDNTCDRPGTGGGFERAYRDREWQPNAMESTLSGSLDQWDCGPTQGSGRFARILSLSAAVIQLEGLLQMVQLF